MQFMHSQNQIHKQSIPHQFSQSYDISMQHNVYQQMQHINTQQQQQQQWMQKISAPVKFFIFQFTCKQFANKS